MKQTFNKREKRKIKTKGDFSFLIILLVLLTLGAIMVFSAGYPYAKSHYDDGAYYIKKHLLFLIIGLTVMVSISLIPIRVIKKASLPFFCVCLLLLVAVLFIGSSEGVAKRWLGIPGTMLTFQPSELMKLGLILMLGWYLDKQKNKEGKFVFDILIPGIIIFASAALVLLEKHLSGTLIIVFIGLSIVFVSGVSIKKMLLFYGLVGASGIAAFLFTNEYAMKRIFSFLDSNADVLSDKWQTTQGLYAIGSGGLFGLGIGNSRQKYSYVSEPQNDFIFTIWCEETGFFGAILLITLFLLLIISGYKIAFKAKDKFSFFVVFGIVSQIAIQTFLNMAVVTDLIPNTGISLPFFSYGGSSLVILLMEMGIIFSVKRTLEKQREDK